MKKTILAKILITGILFGLLACAGGGGSGSSDSDDDKSSSGQPDSAGCIDLYNWKAVYTADNLSCLTCHTTCTPAHNFCEEGLAWQETERGCRGCHDDEHEDSDDDDEHDSEHDDE